MRILWSLFALLATASTHLAIPGTLDPSFGPVGFITTSISSGVDRASAVARQSDGKFLAAGLANNGMSMAIVRYNENGTLDPTFDGDGIATIFMGSTGNEARGIAVQSDGKILITGSSFASGNSQYTVVRLNSNGSLDVTFNGSGIFTDQSSGIPNAISVQSDGKIVTGGDITTSFGFTRELCIVRLNSDGTLDTTFDGDGRAIISMSPQSISFGRGLVIQTDGRIVVGGESNDAFGLARVNQDGSIDTSFNTNGRVRTVFAVGHRSFANSLSLGPNGTIIAVGNADEGNGRGFALARYNFDGSLDSTFDGDGKTVTPETGVANAVVVDADGTIALTGYTILDLTIARYQPNGQSDPDFGSGGIVHSTIRSTGYAIGRGIVRDPAGNYTIVGNVGGGGPTDDFLFARYTSDGTPVVATGSFGFVLTNPFGETSQSSFATSLDVMVNGKSIVGANRIINPETQLGAIIRYNSNGGLDPTFASSTSGNGIATVSVPGASTQELNAITLQPDNRILAVGTYESQSDIGLFLGRFEPSGSIDTTFGGNGNGYKQVGVLNGGGIGSDVVVQPNGKILVAGAFPDLADQSFDFGIYRFEENGDLDLSFGSGGIARVVFTDGVDVAFSITVQDDGSIIAAGVSDLTKSGSGDFAIARLSSNGSLDPSFGSGGKVVISRSPFTDSLTDVDVQSDGKIVASGTACANSGCSVQSGVLIRLSQSGSLDPTFNGTGVSVLSVPGLTSTSLFSFVLQGDRKIIAAGSAAASASGDDAIVIRMLSDGTLDKSFGLEGVARSDIEGGAQEARGVKLQSDGKIVVAGASQIKDRSDVAVWRYLGDSVSAYRAPFDFDGDGKSDVSIYRPSLGQWWWNRSSDSVVQATQFGSATDVVAPGDFTGDGKMDVAFFRPSDGFWYVLRTEDFSFSALPFGTAGDVPVTGDYDGDGKADVAVFRPSSNTWYISRSSDLGTTIAQFGVAGDVPVTADYDGDGKDDIAIYRPSLGQWWISRSSLGLSALQFGTATDKTVPGDYTGDGKADVALWRPSTGEWYIVRSEDSSFFAFPFGQNGDIPAPGDYDGDGKIDPAVFRPSQTTWYIAGSTSGTQIFGFGLSGDRPIPNSFVR